jgi:4-hydroxy-4-methyl-2-oxoglutarate aldolase
MEGEMAEVTAAVREKLQTFDTPTICNLIELFDVRPRNVGFMDGRIQANYPDMGPIVGYAATATFRSGFEPKGTDAYMAMDKQVEKFGELAGPAIVVFQDLDSPCVAATFGEVMCSVYKAFGAVGLITSGAGRDIDQVRAIDFPVWTNGTISSHGYCHIPDVHVPVHVGGIAIYPNDLLHADRNGVTTIPAEIAAEMAEIGDAFVAAEDIILHTVRGGSPTVAQYRDARRESGAAIAKIRQQVTRKTT